MLRDSGQVSKHLYRCISTYPRTTVSVDLGAMFKHVLGRLKDVKSMLAYSPRTCLDSRLTKYGRCLWPFPPKGRRHSAAFFWGLLGLSFVNVLSTSCHGSIFRMFLFHIFEHLRTIFDDLPRVFRNCTYLICSVSNSSGPLPTLNFTVCL